MALDTPLPLSATFIRQIAIFYCPDYSSSLLIRGRKLPFQTSTKPQRTSREPNEERRALHQWVVGSLGFLARQTRPDISYATNTCPRYNSNPSEGHIEALRDVLAYL